MSDGAQLLESIPKLLEKKDAAALVDLRDHDDKKVRKAVRKALHTLKSRGVEIPEAGGRSWSSGDTLKSLRGDLEPSAQLDTRSAPGVTRFLLSDPEENDGARLLIGALGPDDRVLEFNVYRQTDGQRTRLLRDWKRQTGERQVDVGWLKTRIRWAREQTIAAGISTPRSLDEMLSQLGDDPDARPGPFLVGKLDDQPAFDEAASDTTLVTLGVPAWPPMVNLDSMLQKAAEIHGDKPQPEKEDERLELLKQSVAGDDVAREGLKSTLANALEDASVDAWLRDEGAVARAALTMATTLREHDEPETLDWAARLLGYQVASLLRAMGGPEAVAKARAEAGAAGV